MLDYVDQLAGHCWLQAEKLVEEGSLTPMPDHLPNPFKK